LNPANIGEFFPDAQLWVMLRFQIEFVGRVGDWKKDDMSGGGTDPKLKLCVPVGYCGKFIIPIACFLPSWSEDPGDEELLQPSLQNVRKCWKEIRRTKRLRNYSQLSRNSLVAKISQPISGHRITLTFYCKQW